PHDDYTEAVMGPWPKGGEIDIIEGLTRPYTGESTSDNCDAAFNYNTGCGIAFNKPNSYG
ncbi:hypothetical protein MPER_15177, partial [Moniliophthora perniciosa FA553]